MAEYMTQINRDPFARASLMRAKDTTGKCKWCGQAGKYKYAWVSDSVAYRDPAFTGPFCAIDCYRTYTDQENGR